MMKFTLFLGTSVAALTAALTPASAAPVTFSFTGSADTFSALTAGTYEIVAVGASGANDNTNTGARSGGKGAKIVGDFHLTAGEQLKIIVGGSGASGTGFYTGGAGGGGGGSFVLDTGTNTPLLIGGGGGGGSRFSNAFSATGLIAGPGSNGFGGAGGFVTGDAYGGGGGGGGLRSGGGGGGRYGGGGGGGIFAGNGISGSVHGGAGGAVGGGGGGSGSFPSYYHGGKGGFGGGGGGGVYGGGGGGGYNGGGGSNVFGSSAAGAGSSFYNNLLISGLASFYGGFQSGAGYVTLDLLSADVALVAEPCTLALLGMGAGGLGVLRRRRRG